MRFIEQEFEGHKIYYSSACDCHLWPELGARHSPGATKPEYFTREFEAVRAFQNHRQNEEKVGHFLYWAVHLDGLHMLHVK